MLQSLGYFGAFPLSHSGVLKIIVDVLVDAGFPYNNGVMVSVPKKNPVILTLRSAVCSTHVVCIFKSWTLKGCEMWKLVQTSPKQNILLCCRSADWKVTDSSSAATCIWLWSHHEGWLHRGSFVTSLAGTAECSKVDLITVTACQCQNNKGSM